MYKIVNCNFNRDSLIKLFIDSSKDTIKSLYQVTDPLIGNQCIDEIFDQFKFIAHNEHNVTLGEFKTHTKPYISPGNNGILVIPLVGSLVMSFYSYEGARESLSPFRTVSDTELAEIQSTHVETVVIDRPMLVNGLVVHSYKPLDGSMIAAVFKIPLAVSWEDISI